MRHTRIHRSAGQLWSAIPSASGSPKMRLIYFLVGLAAAAEVGPGAHSPQPSHSQRAPRATPPAVLCHREAPYKFPHRSSATRRRPNRSPRSCSRTAPARPKRSKGARRAVKKEESIKLTRGGGAPPIPKPPSGEPPSEEEARRRARRLMRRMSRKRKGRSTARARPPRRRRQY